MQVGGEDETAYTLVFVDGQGDRIMMTGGQGVRGLTLDDDDDAYIRRARVCFTSGYLPWPLLQRVASLCAETGGPALASISPESFDDLEGRGFKRKHLDALLPEIDLFLTSRGASSLLHREETLPDGLPTCTTKDVRRAAVSDGDARALPVRGRRR